MNKLKLVSVMLLWGSIGLFTRYIPLSPIQLAFSRSLMSLPVLIFMMSRKSGEIRLNKKSVLLYILSGVLIGLAWVALFHGYRHTTIALAVIIYNMCPVYVMILAPLVLGEKRTINQSVVIGVAFTGLILIVGSSAFVVGNLYGMIMSGISGFLYAVIVLINRKIETKIESNTATFIQMFSATVILLPFIVKEGIISDFFLMSTSSILLTLALGILHTGIAYSLYFSTYHHMKSIDIVAFSYLEPLFGVFFGMIFLGENLRVYQWCGAVLILGSTLINEYIKSGKINYLLRN